MSELIDVVVELDDDLLLWAALRAHDLKITLNEFIVRVITAEARRVLADGVSCSHWGLHPYEFDY